jgi:parallel beta-helix repeat protein
MDDLDLGATVKGMAPGQKVFGRYTLKRLLGRGGMGVVWLVRDEELGRDSAMKFLPEVVAADRGAIADMKREVRRAIDLAHPHIIKTHDFITDGRTAGVSMELIPGGTLGAARLDEPGQVFGVEKLGPWLRQLCAALEYAHETAEVVHRDLKPTNLMLDARGRLKVVDFGIAASLSDSVSRVSKQAGSSGTPVYMSPQQMMGEAPSVTDDIYAAGATLMELLTGKPPFHAGNILMQVQGKVAPRVNERRVQAGLPPIPAVWDDAIAACLAKDPAQRPASAAALVRLVEGAAPASVSAPPVAEPPPVAPVAAAPAAAPVAAPPKPPGEIGPVRRWLLAPLVGALIPGLTLFLLLQRDLHGGHLSLPYGVLPWEWPAALIFSSAVFGLVWLGFYPVVAVLQATRARGPGVLAAVFGTAGAVGAGAGVRWITEGAVDLGHLTAFATAGALGGVAAAHLTFATGFRRDPALGAVSPVRTWALVAGGLLATILVGFGFPVHLEDVRAAAYAAEVAAWEAQQAEQRRIDEARAEQERIRQRELRTAEAGGMVAEGFRMVFDRAPTAAERENYVKALVENPAWNGSRLRQELRQSQAGKSGGRLLVPEEFKTIQAAVDAAAPGNVVRVAPGLYPGAISITKPISLIGAGAAEVTVEVPPSEGALYIEQAKVTVRGFTFRHRGTSNDDRRYTLVALADGAEVVFENNTVRSANGHGIYTRGSGRKVIRNNLVEGARWDGIIAYQDSLVEIRDNTVQRCEQVGIAVMEPSPSVTVAGNRVRSNKRNGIWVAAGDNVVVELNDVSGNGTEGVLYGGIGIGAGRPRLVGNTAQGNIGGGIWWNTEKANPIVGPGNLSDGQMLPEAR